MLTFVCWFIKLVITSHPNLFQKTDEMQKNGFPMVEMKAMNGEMLLLLFLLRRKEFL